MRKISQMLAAIKAATPKAIKKKTTLPICGLVVLGTLLLLFPTIANQLNLHQNKQLIAEYSNNEAKLTPAENKQLWEAAQRYNQNLAANDTGTPTTSSSSNDEYDEMLNISGNGAMGYIEIPKINQTLPIYHGTDEKVLQSGVGHLDWSSLPVGGDSTHCVLSGHRGLPSAKLFSDLDQLGAGDKIYLHILGQTLDYEVQQTMVVKPQDIESLAIREGEDLCTLVTCTPYGINTERLLVQAARGTQIGTPKATADAVQLETRVFLPLLGLPILAAALLALILGETRQRAKRLMTADTTNK